MIEIVSETGSTNADLLARLREGERVAEGGWLVTDRQISGRGRQGRQWFDGSGNFMGSTIIRPTDRDPPAHTLALVASLALYETVLPILPAPTKLVLKWPNDLLLAGAKLSGILLEREGEAIVLGIGVNLVAAPVLPDRPTTRLSDHTVAPTRDGFAQSLAERLTVELDRWRTFGLEPIIRRWLAAAHPIGTKLRIHDASGHIAKGAFAGLSPVGTLLLRLEDGSTRAIHAGDVTLD